MWDKDVMKEIERLERRIQNLENNRNTLEDVLWDLLKAKDMLEFGGRNGLGGWLPDDRVKGILHKLASDLIKKRFK